MRNALVAAGVACVLASPALAVETSNFNLGTARDLVALCSDQPDDPLYAEALQFCYGFMAGVAQLVQTWMDEHGVVPVAGQSGKDLVLETASERWAPLTPAERHQWLDQRRSRIEQRRATGSAAGLTYDQRAALGERAAGLSPEQRSALRESAQGMSFDRVSGRAAAGGVHRSIRNHPTPSRAGCPEARASTRHEAAVEGDGDAADSARRPHDAGSD